MKTNKDNDTIIKTVIDFFHYKSKINFCIIFNHSFVKYYVNRFDRAVKYKTYLVARKQHNLQQSYAKTL